MNYVLFIIFNVLYHKIFQIYSIIIFFYIVTNFVYIYSFVRQYFIQNQQITCPILNTIPPKTINKIIYREKFRMKYNIIYYLYNMILEITLLIAINLELNLNNEIIIFFLGRILIIILNIPLLYWNLYMNNYTTSILKILIDLVKLIIVKYTYYSMDIIFTTYSLILLLLTNNNYFLFLVFGSYLLRLFEILINNFIVIYYETNNNNKLLINNLSNNTRNKINLLCEECNFSSQSIYIDDIIYNIQYNAQINGFGPFTIISISELLFSATESEDQILSVIIHELGHYKQNHIIYCFVIHIIYNVCFAIIIKVFINLFKKQLISTLYNYLLLYPTINLLLNIIINYILRQFENSADEFVVKLNYGNEFINSLISVTTNNESPIKYDNIYSIIYSSHPDVVNRIQRIKRLSQQNY